MTNKLLEKVAIIKSGNTAILPNGEIVARGTPGSTDYKSQLPEPSDLKTYHQWNFMGRKIKKGQKAWTFQDGVALFRREQTEEYVPNLEHEYYKRAEEWEDHPH